MRALSDQKSLEMQRVQAEINLKSDNNLGLKNQVRDLEAQIAQERTHGLGL